MTTTDRATALARLDALGFPSTAEHLRADSSTAAIRAALLDLRVSQLHLDDDSDPGVYREARAILNALLNS